MALIESRAVSVLAFNFLNIALTLLNIFSTGFISWEYGFTATDSDDIDGLGRLVDANEVLIGTGGEPVARNLDYSYDGLGQLTGASMSNIDSSTWTGGYF